MAEIRLNEKVVVALAKTKGIDLTEEKAVKLLALVQNDKLSDEDLDKVTGGKVDCETVLIPGGC